MVLNVAYEQQSTPGIASLVRSGLAATISNWPPLLELFQPTTARLIVEPRITRTVSIAYSVHRPLSSRPPACATWCDRCWWRR